MGIKVKTLDRVGVVLGYTIFKPTTAGVRLSYWGGSANGSYDNGQKVLTYEKLNTSYEVALHMYNNKPEDFKELVKTAELLK